MPASKNTRKPKAKKPSRRLTLARRGEQRATDYLVALGFKIVARNWRSPETANELDVICEDGDCLVFVEVKTARTMNYGDPITWITPRKQKAIIRAAESYLAVNNPSHQGFRFDTITISAPQAGEEAPLVHTRAAFTAS
jgi:putative endonuclease